MSDENLCCNLTDCMFVGMLCTNSGFNFDNFVCLCINKNECLCIKSESCIAGGIPDKGVGIITEDDECFKIGCYCCNCALISPKVLCKSAEQCLCCYQVSSLPCDDAYVPAPFTCAFYGIQCAPNCGCCGQGPKSSALLALKSDEAPTSGAMDRQ